MSSRNSYLNTEERKAAASLYKALSRASEEALTGNKSPAEVSKLLHAMLSSENLITAVDYASVYNPETLQEIETFSSRSEFLIALAVRLGKTRLIDNIMVNF